jgi:rhodanese-related sulfurtransferase
MAANETETEAGSETELAPARVAEMIDAGDVQLVDVREGYEHEAGHIPGSRHIDLQELKDQAETLDRSKAVVFYCRSGDRSSMPAEAFRNSGWDAHNMAGGLTAWSEAGLPIEPEGGTVAQRRPGPQN